MMVGCYKILSLGLLSLASVVVSSPWHSRDFTALPALFQRQDNTDTEPPLCEAACDFDTCGAGACNVRGLSAGLTRRSFQDNFLHLSDIAQNVTTDDGSGDGDGRLSKRIWRFDATSNNAVGNRAPTVGEVDAYLPAVFEGAEDGYFGDYLTLAAGDQRAVSQEVEFENGRPFQIMTGGIHGCMTVTLVSNRAVWMAHFWETYSNGNPPRDGPGTDGFFVDRVIKFINGEKVGTPAPYRHADNKPNLPYIEPDGQAPTKSLFDGDDDETVLYISTPIDDGQVITNRDAKIRYKSRVDAMKTAFRRRIGRRPEVVVLRYDRLNYDKKEELELENSSHRGMHLFQFDPNSDNNGQAAWRYFAEQVYHVKNVPTPP